MAKFVVIKDILNVRDKPILSDEHFIGSLKLGEEIDLLEEPMPGEKPEGTDDNMWLSDGMPRVVSRPGVALAGTYEAKKAQFLADPFNKQFFDENDKHNESKWKVSWGHVDLEIWRIWKEYDTKGEKVSVAIIDTGVLDTENDLKNKVDHLLSKNLRNNNNDIEDKDFDLHGTKTAGIIASNALNVNTVFGIAPSSKLIIYKVMDNADGTGLSESNIIRAMRKAREAGADIISISIAMLVNPPGLQEEINECKKNNIIVCAAVGNTNGSAIRFPASCSNVIAIGAYGILNNLPEVFSDFSAISPHLTCITPGKDILTTGKFKAITKHNGTSAATPFAAGIFALVIAYLKKKQRILTIKELFSLIEKGCSKIDKTSTKDSKEGFGILTPTILFNLIK